MARSTIRPIEEHELRATDCTIPAELMPGAAKTLAILRALDIEDRHLLIQLAERLAIRRRFYRIA